MKCWSQIGQCTTVCANAISVMGSVMGQFPLRDGVLLVVAIIKVKSIGQWGKIVVWQ